MRRGVGVLAGVGEALLRRPEQRLLACRPAAGGRCPTPRVGRHARRGRLLGERLERLGAAAGRGARLAQRAAPSAAPRPAPSRLLLRLGQHGVGASPVGGQHRARGLDLHLHDGEVVAEPGRAAKRHRHRRPGRAGRFHRHDQDRVAARTASARSIPVPAGGSGSAIVTHGPAGRRFPEARRRLPAPTMAPAAFGLRRIVSVCGTGGDRRRNADGEAAGMRGARAAAVGSAVQAGEDVVEQRPRPAPGPRWTEPLAPQHQPEQRAAAAGAAPQGPGARCRRWPGWRARPSPPASAR